MTKADALVLLLSRPDPPDLIGRGFHLTCPRSPFSDPDTIKRDLGTAYVEHRRQDHADLSAVIAVHHEHRLQIVRRACG